MGRRARSLLHGLAAYLATEGSEAASEAQAIGEDYALRARASRLSIVDAVRAFLFFRNLMLEALVSVYQEANVPGGEAWQEMLHRVHNFTDRILLALLETYQAFESAGRSGSRRGKEKT